MIEYVKDHENEQIALEISKAAMESFAFVETLKEKFKLLKFGFTDAARNISNFNGNKPSTSDKGIVTTMQKDAIAKINSTNWLELGELGIYTIEGLKGELLPYLFVLEEACDRALGAEKDVLVPYYTLLCGIISNKEYRKSNTPDIASYKRVSAKDEACLEMLKKHVGGNKDSRRKLLEVVRRGGDMKVAIEKANEIQEHIERVNSGSLVDQCKQIAEALNIITDMLKDDKLDGVSPTMIEALATSSFVVAEHVRFISMISFSGVAAVKCVNGICSKIVDPKAQ